MVPVYIWSTSLLLDAVQSANELSKESVEVSIKICPSTHSKYNSFDADCNWFETFIKLQHGSILRPIRLATDSFIHIVTI